MQINFARREIACKIVYYGPGMSGKTTNLEVLHNKTPREHKGELTCIATEGDRTLFFDFMPLNLGNIRGMNTKFQLYTVPGQVYYNSTRKLVLRGVDGVIFVADSAPDKMDENLESLRNLEENLREYGRDVGELPIILQYNKRDRPDAVDPRVMNDKMNPGKRPWFEAVATDGTGVFDCLKALAGLVIQNLDVQTARSDEPAAAAVSAADASKELVGARALEGVVASEAASSGPAPRTSASAVAPAAPATGSPARNLPSANPPKRGSAKSSSSRATTGSKGAKKAKGMTARGGGGRPGSTPPTARSASARPGSGPRSHGRTANTGAGRSAKSGNGAHSPARQASSKGERKSGNSLIVFALGLVAALSAAGAAWFFWLS